MRGTKTEIRPGVWRLRVYAGRRPNGTPIQISRVVKGPDTTPGSGTRLADRELAKLVAEVAKGVNPGNETLDDVVDEWLDHSDSLGRSPTTLREYRRIAKKVISPELGKVKLSKLSARDLNHLYAKLTARGNKATTVRRVHALISAALRYAENCEMVDRNVARRAQPPIVHAPQVEAPSPEEVRAILVEAEKVEPPLATLLLLAALTGARRGELCALRWPDVDFDLRTLVISRSVYESAGGGWAEKATKTHQSRTVGLDELGAEALRRHRETVDALAKSLDLAVPADAFVFSRSPIGSEPIRPDVVTKFTTRIAKAAGVDTHLHALRHFSATQAIAAGFDPVTVSGRLGHSDPSVTLRVYSHVLEQRDRESGELRTIPQTRRLPRQPQEEVSTHQLEEDHGDCPDHYRRCPSWLSKYLEGADGDTDLAKSHAHGLRRGRSSRAQASMQCDAGYGERTDERDNSRNGYRPRRWDTRAGSIEPSRSPSSAGGLQPRVLAPPPVGGPNRPSSSSSARPMCRGLHLPGRHPGQGLGHRGDDQVRGLPPRRRSRSCWSPSSGSAP